MAVERGIPTQEVPPQIPRLPVPSKTESLIREEKDDERDIIRMAQRKLWARKDFRKATKGKGFMQKKFNVGLPEENGALLKIGYSRTRHHEVLSMNWARISPNRKLNLLYEQDMFLASSSNPRLSTSYYVSRYHKVENGMRTFHRGGSGAMELSSNDTKRELRSFIAYFL